MLKTNSLQVVLTNAAQKVRRFRFEVVYIALSLSILLFLSGCAAMANPDDSDLPWAETPAWELSPNLPGSIMNQ